MSSLVIGRDGESYLCVVADFCNDDAEVAYSPEYGMSSETAWTRL